MSSPTSSPWFQRIDHLALATPNLAEGIQYIEDLLGVSVQPGGKHPAWGTHNVLIALGPNVFLELIAPDPERADPAIPPLFGIDQLTKPKLTAWAVKESNLQERLNKLEKNGISFGHKLSGQRRKPDGTILKWELSDPLVVVGNGVIPFLLDWGQTPHPAANMPQACQLLDFRIEHPDVNRIEEILQVLELNGMPVKAASEPGLMASISTPHGVVELR